MIRYFSKVRWARCERKALTKQEVTSRDLGYLEENRIFIKESSSVIASKPRSTITLNFNGLGPKKMFMRKTEVSQVNSCETDWRFACKDSEEMLSGT